VEKGPKEPFLTGGRASGAALGTCARAGSVSGVRVQQSLKQDWLHPGRPSETTRTVGEARAKPGESSTSAGRSAGRDEAAGVAFGGGMERQDEVGVQRCASVEQVYLLGKYVGKSSWT
jgi:hypothetical protein